MLYCCSQQYTEWIYQQQTQFSEFMNWYEDEVHQLIQRRNELPYPPLSIFYGSSTIRLWDTLYEDFNEFQPVNLGFGGSTLEACVYFFNRIVTPLQTAERMFVYAGDNDLGDGKSPEAVLHYFKQFSSEVKKQFPDIPCYYISIKPSFSRWNINDNIQYTNQLIAAEIELQKLNFQFINIYDAMLGENGYPNPAYYEEDGLHLSKQGYNILTDIIRSEGFASQSI